MKNLSRIKIGAVLVLIISGLAGLALITSCGTGEGTRSGTSSSGKDPGSSSSGNDDDDEITLDCSLSSKGSPCEDSKKCEDWCDDELELSGSALDECKDLGEDTVEDLVKVFDDVFRKPTQDDLNDLDLEDLELMCGAVKKIGRDILEEKTDDYTASSARNFLAWMAEKDEVLDIFKTIEETEEDGDEEALKMIKALIEKIGSGNGDEAILNGLKAPTLGEEGDQHFLAIAQDNNNSGLIKYIHNNLIDNDQELCDEDNHPSALAAPTSASSDKGVSERTDGREACVLGVYCTIAPPKSDDDTSEELREKISQIVSINFNRLVKASVADGGFGLTEEDAEEWTNNACYCLANYWEADTNLDVVNGALGDGADSDCPTNN